MAGNILTPSAIWNDFTINGVPTSQVISEKIEDDIIFTFSYVDGREVNGERVKIYTAMARKVQQSISPAILLVQDLDCDFNLEIMKDLASRGYLVLSADLSGGKEGKEFFTVYPELVSYANYENVKDNLYKVEGEVVDTCWYEWVCVLKYALKFLSAQPTVNSVGAFGYGEAGTALWQVAGTGENQLSCAVFALNAGWNGYRNINKFGGMVEPQFDDDMYKFIAGVEPQAYAMHVKCPTLMLSSTNSPLYDADRAYDTLSRIENAKTVMHYSVGCSGKINQEGYNNLINFFELFLKKEGAKSDDFPYETDISCAIIDGQIVVTVEPFMKKITDVELFVSEEVSEPSLRCWQKVVCGKKEENKFIFTYSPYPESNSVTMFAQAKYKGYLTVGSKIINKKFKKEEMLPSHKSNILYSSRIKNAESVFYSASQKGECSLFTDGKDLVKVKKGPMGIEGVSCDAGLLTFKFCTKKDRPSDDALLMFDVYAENKGEITVKLISDYFGDKKEYLSKINLLGGEVWQNVKLEVARFKTAEGMSLKSIEKIDAVEFSVSDGEYLINNALWL